MRKYFLYVLVALGIAGVFLMIYYSVPPRPQSAESSITWHKVRMDGSRAGIKPVTATNASEAIGTIADDGYHAPSGVVYPADGIVAQAAQILLDCQPGLAESKEVIAHSSGMYMNDRDKPDLPLGNLVADVMRERGSREFGVKMDVAVTNYGGIRIPMPEGPVTRGDIQAMFPFDNKLAYVKISGEELLRLMNQLAKTAAFQPVSGVRVRVKDGAIQDITVGGKPINKRKIYNLVTVDFLLTGGDQLYIGAMATDLKESNLLIRDVMMDYVVSCGKAHKNIVAVSDGRVIMEKTED